MGRILAAIPSRMTAPSAGLWGSANFPGPLCPNFAKMPLPTLALQVDLIARQALQEFGGDNGFEDLLLTAFQPDYVRPEAFVFSLAGTRSYDQERVWLDQRGARPPLTLPQDQLLHWVALVIHSACSTLFSSRPSCPDGAD